ncbi:MULTISPECIES: ABC transporter ATP-binding protein [Rhizobium]|uniref:ATP-binding cassette domain-containing protein n=1 Tax=Rhizobium leguminosarum bv. viciae TaxID=387 RepID=A0A8G2MNS8_RHILV|nr:oligopeptide/dipeptide ABC transporter ATP-binding protein [Rhizobium leguminosarum]MBB4510516.1 oligopeptide/dipeptide ABC transporter ATP-binding protein [Rhizobium leguminosarum]NKK11549.1 ATP-binding cassette domain-containing protein [Rhizobium leguminosarum bv. viciae]NKK25535.1 ATP-binding cassette domain-containing protein [Rhizobium leguminosarum bv. viciae]TBX84970.1 ATP-binding cassette domain-containing protein [Rhizobium leguminosarum bv. viciae]TBZ09375.1 ATP-binding cassette 
MTELLTLDGINVDIPIGGGFLKPRVWLQAVNDVSLTVARGETLALVGESGSGKSTLGYVVAGLRKQTAGTVTFNSARAGGAGHAPVQVIFQDPFSALDPRMVVGEIVAEPLRLKGVAADARQARAVEVLGQVGLPPESARRYPHQFSGGQRQRIAIARALIAEPEMIVADEPLSALDVSIQSQVLNLLDDIKKEHGISYLFISHDLGVVRHLADRVAVLYLGRLMEVASSEDLFLTPSHPYTKALLAAVPRIGRGRRKKENILRGEIPSPLAPPSGCVFHTRCPRAQDVCKRERPELLPAPGRPTQLSACHFKD